MAPRGPPVPTMYPAAHIGNRRGRAHGREGRTARWRRDGRRNAEKAEAGRQDACDDERTHLNLLGLVVDAHLRVACGSVEIHISSMAWCRNALLRVAQRRLGLAPCVAALIVVFGTATAEAQERPRLETNEAYVEEVGRTTALQITDATGVLAFVLEGLPSRVKVYPTENYYYFRFIHNGTPYAGSI